jgi:hypothetical protein
MRAEKERVEYETPEFHTPQDRAEERFVMVIQGLDMCRIAFFM